MDIQIAYASKYGSTHEVADAIAWTMRERRLRVDVIEAAEVDSLAGYGAVVLGGGIYMGRWHRDARRLARRLAEELDGLPVAVFALGPVDEEPEHLADSERQFRAALDRLPFEPFATALFGGAVDPLKLSFPFSRMAPADVRDWQAIRAWALRLSDELAGAALQTGR